MSAFIPENETARLAALHEHNILDTASEEVYDDLVRLAAQVCGTPIAAVTLIDEHRQWFKSIVGLEVTETPRDVSFCADTLLQSDLIVVPDATKDKRFAGNPFVTGEPNIRFYAGMPLITDDGFALGSLCVIDREVRTLTSGQEDTLRLLARQVSNHLKSARRLADRERLMAEKERVDADLQQSKYALAESQRFAQNIVEHSANIIFVFDLDTMSNTYTNHNAVRFWADTSEANKDLVQAIIHPDDLSRLNAHLSGFKDIADGQVVEFECRTLHAGSEWRWMSSREVIFKRHSDGTPWHILGNAVDVTESKRIAEALAASEARLSEAQRVAKIGSWEYDTESGNIKWSREMFRLVGRDEALGEPAYGPNLSLYYPEDAAALASLVSRATHEGLDYVIDLRLADTASPIEWRQAIGSVTRDLEGRVVRISGTLADITERKTLEAELREHAESLRQSEASLRAVLEGAPVILYAADQDGIVTLSEGTGLSVLGLKPGDAVGHSVFAFSNNDESVRNTRRALAGESVSYDVRLGDICLHTDLSPLSGADGNAKGFIGVCYDVTERVQSEERFRVLFEQSSNAHLLFDDNGIIDCNGAAVAMLRCTDKAQLLSLHPAALSPEFQADGARSMEKCVEMDSLAREFGCHQFEWVHRRLNGEDFPVQVTLTKVTLESRPVLLAGWLDLTERKSVENRLQEYALMLEFQKIELERANAALEELATTDGLTGIWNHRAFQDRLADETARNARYGSPLSLILLDVDHFKEFNDSFGHPAGDSVLRTVAQILKAGARDTDIVARYGGEEFVILLPQTEIEAATAIAERLQAALVNHIWPIRKVTASFGVASLRLNEMGSDLISSADVAMYRSKTEGRNVVTIDSAQHAVGM